MQAYANTIFPFDYLSCAGRTSDISPFKSYAGTLPGCSSTIITKNLQLDHATTSNVELSDTPSLQEMNDVNEKYLRKCLPFQ